MKPALRWALVALVTVGVLAPAVLHRTLPASASPRSAVALAAVAEHSTDLAWSGEVRSRGTLAVPDVGDFGGVARLFGQESDLRVWWHDPEHWRVDRTRTQGESDLIRSTDRVVRWSYESKRATTTRYSSIRLPDETDVLPSSLAHRLLDGAKPDELSRLPARRVDGHSAAGLRFSPSDPRTTLDHLDLWLDEKGGLPLLAEVYADNTALAVLTSQVSDLSRSTPSLDRTRFAFPKGIRVTTSYAIDDAAGANAFAPFQPPESVAGLPRRGDQRGGVGVYGRGPTSLIVIPLRRKIGSQVYRQLQKSPAATTYGDGSIGLAVGPLGIRLRGSGRGLFLLTGFVTPATLSRASADLAGVGYRQYAPRDRRLQNDDRAATTNATDRNVS